MGTVFRSGFVAIVGQPNVGKSTLLNNLVGYKVAIISDKPQTTRTSIQGILNLEDAQIVFVDTPGLLYKPRHSLAEYMTRVTERVMVDVDTIAFMTEANYRTNRKDEKSIARLKELAKPVVLVINKIDRVEKERLLPFIDDFSKMMDFAAIVPISALKRTNLDGLVAELKALLPIGPKLYPEDVATDQPREFFLAELIREKALELLYQEVPHSITVKLDEMSERQAQNLYYIRATIFVESDSQKGIVIGKGGAMLKNIGKRAREEMELWLDKKVFLELWVKVKKNWRKNEYMLRELGFRE